MKKARHHAHGCRTISKAKVLRERQRYLEAPASTQGRIEDVFAFVAQSAAESVASTQPRWLTNPHLPIPRFSGLDRYQPPNPVAGFVAAAIDGRACIADIASTMVNQLGIPKDGAAKGVRATLQLIFEHCKDLDTE